MNFGIDFRHAVEFSRIGRTPYPQPFGLDSGATCVTLPVQPQPVNPAVSDSATRDLGADPAVRLGPAALAFGGSERPAAFASRTRSNKKNIT